MPERFLKSKARSPGSIHPSHQSDLEQAGRHHRLSETTLAKTSHATCTYSSDRNMTDHQQQQGEAELSREGGRRGRSDDDG